MGVDRAMWVWDTSDPAAVVAVARAAGVARLFAAVPPRVGTSPVLAQLAELVRLAHSAGQRVDALGGDPAWVDEPAEVVDRWLGPALATGLFAGVHVDVEPWTTVRWRTDRPRVVTAYLALLDALRAAVPGVPLEADIAFWLDQVPVDGSTLDREVLRRTDGAVVMAYRNTAQGPDGSVALAAAAVAAGEELGVPVRIGQETCDLGPGPVQRKQTFAGLGRARLEVEVGRLGTAYAASPAFAGVALHDCAGYAALTP